MRDVKRACRTWNGNINHHVALAQYLFTDAVALIADDESDIVGKFSLVYVCSIGGSLDGYDFFICRYDFAKVVFLGEIPFYVIFAGSRTFPDSAKAVCWFSPKKNHFGSTDVVGETNHRTHVVGSKEIIGDDDGAGNGIVEGFGMRRLKKIVGFDVHVKTIFLGKCFFFQGVFQLMIELGRSGG